jgi:RNA polymerase primary sigma factor
MLWPSLHKTCRYSPICETPGERDSDLRRFKKVMSGLLDTLGKREKEVLKMRFGLDGCEPQTLKTIGAKYSLTRERIRQIEASALKKLRHPTRFHPLADER